MQTLTLRCALACLLAAVVPAQTYVVDVLNGPGAQFTDLPQAIASVPSGAVLLVRPGVYSPFSFGSKALTILGSGYTVKLTAPIVIGPTTAGQSVRISGMGLLAGAAGDALELRGCAGEVLLERCTSSGPLSLLACQNVHLHGCTLAGGLTALQLQQPPGFTTMLTVFASSVEITGSRIEGQRFTYLSGGIAGGTGIYANNGARVVLAASNVTGGTNTGGHNGAGPGGPAIELVFDAVLDVAGVPSGASPTRIVGGAGGTSPDVGPYYTVGGPGIALAAQSQARVLGATVLGGTSFPATNSGPAFQSDASSSYAHDPAAQPPRAEASGDLVAQTTVTVTLHGTPRAAAALCLATVSVLQPFPGLASGVLAVPLSGFVAGLVLPPSGEWVLPLTVPGGIPVGSFVVGQLVTFDAAKSELATSGSFAVVARK